MVQLIMVLPGRNAEECRKAAANALLDSMAQDDENIRVNWEAEKEQRGDNKRIQPDEREQEYEVVKKRKEYAEIASLNRHIADDIRATAEIGVEMVNIHDRLIRMLPDGIHKAKSEQYILNQRTNLITRIAEGMSSDLARPEPKRIENGEQVVPNAVCDGLPLTIGMILHEKGIKDTLDNKISKAMGKIAVTLYRAKHDKDPPQSMLILPNNLQVWSNSYTQADRDILLRAYEEYAGGVDLRAEQEKEKRAAKDAKAAAREKAAQEKIALKLRVTEEKKRKRVEKYCNCYEEESCKSKNSNESESD
jgi:hypothetical protein